jgi:hypothetical protein
MLAGPDPWKDPALLCRWICRNYFEAFVFPARFDFLPVAFEA